MDEGPTRRTGSVSAAGWAQPARAATPAAGARVLEEALRIAAAEAPSGARPATGVISYPSVPQAYTARRFRPNWQAQPPASPQTSASACRNHGSGRRVLVLVDSREGLVRAARAKLGRGIARPPGDPAPRKTRPIHAAWKPASKSFSRSSRRTPWRRCCPERRNSQCF